MNQLHIIHLDDHLLYATGVKEALVKYFPDIVIKNFTDTKLAFEYYFLCLQKKIKIDLVITDFFHHGPNGLFFAKGIRDLGKLFSVRVPILLLTFCDYEKYFTNIDGGIIDAYFPKTVHSEELIEFVKNHTCTF